MNSKSPVIRAKDMIVGVAYYDYEYDRIFIPIIVKTDYRRSICTDGVDERNYAIDDHGNVIIEGIYAIELGDV